MSNFKMKHQGVPALMKTLTSGQQGMIKSMKKSGKTAQAESIKKGIEDAPPKKITDKNRKEVGRGGKDVVISEKESIVNRRDNANSGKRDFEQVTQTVEKGSNAPVGTTMADRQGGGRTAKKTYQRAKGQKGKYTMVGSTVSGSVVKGGRSQYRDGSDTGTKDPKTGKRTYKSQSSSGGKNRVLIEASVKGPKARGVQSPKVKKTDISKDLKARAPRKKVKRVNEITKTAATMKKGVKGLKKAALKKYGKKK